MTEFLTDNWFTDLLPDWQTECLIALLHIADWLIIITDYLTDKLTDLPDLTVLGNRLTNWLITDYLLINWWTREMLCELLLDKKTDYVFDQLID